MVVTWAYNAGTNTATASGAGSTNFAALVAADVAGGWGVYTADASGTQFIFAGKIVIGDASTATVLSDTLKQILFPTGVVTANFQTYIYVRNNSTITLGSVIDPTVKSTNNGCFLIAIEPTYDYCVLVGRESVAATTNFYSCTFSGINTRNVRIQPANGNLWGNIFVGKAAIVNGLSCDYFNNQIHYNSNSGLGFESSTGTCDKLYITDAYSALTTFRSIPFGVSNAYIRGCSYLYHSSNTRNLDDYLVNVDSDTWAMLWLGTHTGKVYRQYEFDVETDVSATVTLKNGAGANVFSVTADGTTGKIATQTVSRGYYDQANGNTLQDYGPFSLTISKAGYLTYVHTGIVLDKKGDWRVSLHPQLSGDAIAGDVMLGKTFYSNDADTKLTGTYTPTQLMEQRTKIRRVENPVDELLLMYTGMLTIENQKLRRNRIEPKPS